MACAALVMQLKVEIEKVEEAQRVLYTAPIATAKPNLQLNSLAALDVSDVSNAGKLL